MSQIPHEKSVDSSLALLSDGYTFISKRCQRYQSDIFATRLMLRNAICVMGEEAARMFYHPDRFTRVGAMPLTTLMLLQDKGSVQMLDGEAHRQRKHMFTSLLMDTAGIQRLADVVDEQWRAQIEKWQAINQVVLLTEAREILCRAVCQWAAVPLSESEVQERTREFGAMIDGAGSVGPQNLRGLLLRTRTERWASDLITQVRTHKLEVPQDSVLYVIAWHKEPGGALMSLEVATVELLNVLRPTVAIAQFIVFAALALHEYPTYRQWLVDGEDDTLEMFVQEVRRYYPFFPLIAGCVRQEFMWRDHRFSTGTWMLLDLYGTDHDGRIWEDPETFRPERFHQWDKNLFTLIPQGGGDYENTHRCPGEWITIELTKTAVRLLTTAMRYDVPEQDLRIDLSKMPAKPASGFVIQNVRRA
jgi:fatty-acid peroxygenase